MKKFLSVSVALYLVLVMIGCATAPSPSSQASMEPEASVVPEEVVPVFKASSMLGKLETTDIEQVDIPKMSGFYNVPADSLLSETQYTSPIEASLDISSTKQVDDAVSEDAVDTFRSEQIFQNPELTLIDNLLKSPIETSLDINSTVQEKNDIPEDVEVSIQPKQDLEPLVPSPSPKQSNIMVTAIGTGLSENEARSDALVALSGILYSKVSSTIETKDKVNEIAGIEVANTSSFSEQTKVSTDLPILGASYSLLPQTAYDPNRKAYVYQVEAVMLASVSLPLYERELASLAATIRSAELDYPSSADSLAQESALQKLLDAYLEFERLSYVARTLGSEAIPTLAQTRYSLEARLRQVEKVVDSYTKAACTLTKSIGTTGVYVYPAKLNNSGGVTEFAEQLAFSMGEALGAKAVSDPKRASHFLFGSYTLVDDGKSGMYVTYRLEDQTGTVITTSTAELPPLVYQGQRFIPVAYDFQKQLERGDSVDSGFFVDIRMNGMKDYLSFHRGDELTIEVKASEPCYFYVVGYVFNELDEKFAYLFPLSLDASGKDMFVRRVSPEEVNRWIIINPVYRGKVMPIEVIEPFGVEMLQVYASTERDYQKFLDSVPGFRTTRDYYLVSDNPEEGLRLTRALNIKRVSEEASSEIKRSEAFVSFKSGR